MTSVMRCRVRLFFVARIHCRARVSSKMTSMMRSEKFYVAVDARSHPLIYRSYVVCRTVERKYYFVMAATTVAGNIEKLEVPPCITIGYISRITISKISGWGPPAGVYAYKIIKEVRETV